MKPIFNYIITIHNKESIIEAVLNSVIKCCHENSSIYPVLDGCTDNSLEIVNKVIVNNPKVSITKIELDDVHELKAINAALRILDHNNYGFNIILQDDVILNDENIESKVANLYKWAGPKLGIISFRLGVNLSRLLLTKKSSVLPLKDYIENINGHATKKNNFLFPNQFTYREIAVKSPICVPFYIVKNVGLPDEDFAPWDDINYCYQALAKGYNNGVFAIDFASDISWGSMRSKPQKISHDAIINKNVQLFKERNKHLFESKKDIYDLTIYSTDDSLNYNPICTARMLDINRVLHFVKRLKLYLLQ